MSPNQIIINGLVRMINTFQIETGEKPVSITINRRLFDSLLKDCSYGLYNIINVPRDPYTDGITIGGVIIGWQDKDWDGEE